MTDPDNIRRRSACDRCHSQKLRCPRRPGVDVCDRCAKARATCVYSPFRQKTIVKERTEESPVIPDRNDRGHPYMHAGRHGMSEVGTKRKRTAPPSLSNLEHGLENSLGQHDPLIVDTMGFDWASNSYPHFSDLEIDPAFGEFNFDNLHGGQPLNHLYTTSDSSGVSDTPSPASYEAGSDSMSSMPFAFQQPLHASSNGNMFQLESPTSSAHAFDNVNFAPRLDQELPLGRFMATSPVDSTKDLQPGASQKCVRQLSELSISLYEHSTTLPSQVGTDSVLDMADKSSKSYSDFNLDETFHLTQNLIDIYPAFVDILKRRQSSLATVKSNPPYTAQPAFEQSSILLILSCHLRLIEIYEELFPHMEVCISHKGQAFNTQQALNKSPFVRFGGFAPPSSSTVSMQMMFLVQLAKKLLDCATELSNVTQGLKDLEGKDEAAGGRTNLGAGSLDISLITSENVNGRASNMAQQLGTLRDLMLQMGIFA